MQESFQVWKMGKTVFLLSGDSIHTCMQAAATSPSIRQGKQREISLIMATNVYSGCRKRQRILQRGSLGMKHKERRGA
jgi:hypothetical protein